MRDAEGDAGGGTAEGVPDADQRLVADENGVTVGDDEPQDKGLAAGHALGVGKGFACSCAEPVNSHVPRVGHHAHPEPSTWHALHCALPPLHAANGATGAPALAVTTTRTPASVKLESLEKKSVSATPTGAFTTGGATTPLERATSGANTPPSTEI